MSVAVIPARGGSKRIPGKNIRQFAGKPMIAYSIEAARRSRLFERIIVSTDSPEIAALARGYGVEAPFVRPAELADDFATSINVYIHALEWLQNQGACPQYACMIYATAPFICEKYLKKGFDCITRQKVSSVFAVTTFPSSIFRALRISQAGCLEMVWPQYETTRSNDLEESYHDAGQFYWVHVEQFLKTKRVYTVDAHPVVLPRYLAQDIDTEEDWLTAEAMYLALKERNKGQEEDKSI